jgi:hypothetical protein
MGSRPSTEKIIGALLDSGIILSDNVCDINQTVFDNICDTDGIRDIIDAALEDGLLEPKYIDDDCSNEVVLSANGKFAIVSRVMKRALD